MNKKALKHMTKEICCFIGACLIILLGLVIAILLLAGIGWLKLNCMLYLLYVPLITIGGSYWLYKWYKNTCRWI
jgi:hypothetical protein